MPITLVPSYAKLKLKAENICNNRDRRWLCITHYILHQRHHEIFIIDIINI